MNTDKIKHVEVNGRNFAIFKMSAKTSLKVTKLLAAKVLPFLDSFMGPDGKVPDWGSLDEFLSGVSLDAVSEAMDKINEADLDKLIDYGLSHCYEKLPAGQTQALNPNGTYGAAGIEDDMLFTLRLAAEAIMWSVSGFFDASRWSSMFQGMFQGMGALSPQHAPTSTTSTAASSFSAQS